MITNSNITIVAPDCGSYYLHQHFGMKYNTPFVDNYISIDNYLAILENFNNIDFNNIREVNRDMYLREGGEKVDAEYKYPIVCLDDQFIIHPMHCINFQEFKTKWLNRVQRMNFHNLVFMFCDYRYGSEPTNPEYGKEDLDRFLSAIGDQAAIVYTDRLKNGELNEKLLIMPRATMDMEMHKHAFEDSKYIEFINNIDKISRT